MYEFVLLFGMVTTTGHFEIGSVAEFHKESDCLVAMHKLNHALEEYNRPAISNEILFSCFHRAPEVEI